jgi:hypothetical protein
MLPSGRTFQDCEEAQRFFSARTYHYVVPFSELNRADATVTHLVLVIRPVNCSLLPSFHSPVIDFDSTECRNGWFTGLIAVYINAKQTHWNSTLIKGSLRSCVITQTDYLTWSTGPNSQTRILAHTMLSTASLIAFIKDFAFLKHLTVPHLARITFLSWPKRCDDQLSKYDSPDFMRHDWAIFQVFWKTAGQPRVGGEENNRQGHWRAVQNAAAERPPAIFAPNTRPRTPASVKANA